MTKEEFTAKLSSASLMPESGSLTKIVTVLSTTATSVIESTGAVLEKLWSTCNGHDCNPEPAAGEDIVVATTPANDSSNLTGGVYPNPSLLSQQAKVGLIVLYSLTTLLAIVGNIVVILVFTAGKRSRTDLRPFLINLAVADLIMAAFCMPFTFTNDILKSWIFTKPVCPMALFMQLMSVTSSVFTNMAIGIDRFLVVTFPLKSRLTSARAKYVITAIWLTSIGLSSVQIFVGKAKDIKKFPGYEYVSCEEDWPSVTSRRLYTSFILFITYILPLTILGVTYSIVGVILWRRTSPGNADRVRDLQQLRSKRKVIKMLVIVVTMFGLCWLPLHVFFLVIDFNPELLEYETLEDEKFLIGLYLCVHWLAMSNSFANPIIYGFTNESFRADLVCLCIRFFPCCICLKKLMQRKISLSTYDTVVFRRQSTMMYNLKSAGRLLPGKGMPNGHSRSFYESRQLDTIDIERDDESD